ncbi:MAG: hypothetical protein ACOCRK_01235 [bacterium]
MEQVLDVGLKIIAFLIGTGVLGVIATYAGKQMVKMVKKTPTKIDDEILKSIGNVGNVVLDEKDLGDYERVIRKLLDGLEQAPQDTSKEEEKLKKELEAVKK